MIALACLVATLAAFGLGFMLGRRKVSALRVALGAQRQLAEELDSEIRRLRLSALLPPRKEPARGSTPIAASKAPSGSLNALHALRSRLGFARGDVAQALGIPLADVETIECTRLGLLDVEAVELFVGTLGCRLDIVAQHVDGEAIWLSSERAAPAARRFPPTVRLVIVPGAVVDGQSGHNWDVADLAGRLLASGWSPGSESDAREAAWQALEEIGLVGGEGGRS